MIDAKKLLDWSDAVHARWAEWLRKADPEILRTNFEVSFLTPLGVLTHMSNVENGYMDIVEGVEEKWARHSTKKFTDLEPVLAYAKETRDRTRRLVATTDSAKRFNVAFAEGGALSLEQILFTLVTHEQAHRGEILAICWQRNIEPAKVDYPVYATPLSRLE